MASVVANQALLTKIIAEGDGGGNEEGGDREKERKYGVDELLGEVVGEVYEVVDGLREEMEFMLEEKWVGLPLGGEVEWGGEGEEVGEVMRRDYEYLVKMKEMDEEIQEKLREGGMEKKQLELSSVVPVSGLVMARFHVYNCELNTAIWHWETREKRTERKKKESESQDEEREEENDREKEEEIDSFFEEKESELWADMWEVSLKQSQLTPIDSIEF